METGQPNEQLLTVKVTDDVIAALDDFASRLQARAPGTKVTRAAAVKTLITLALEQEPSRGRVRVLRYVILGAIGRCAGTGGRASLREVRKQLREVSRELFDRIVLELEQEGAIQLGVAHAPTDDDRAHGIQDARGLLVEATLQPLTKLSWASLSGQESDAAAQRQAPGASRRA